MALTKEEQLIRLEGCAKIRNIAAQTCLLVFQHTLNSPNKVSELNFRNRWGMEFEKAYFRGFVGCWYEPPPGGVGVLFGSDKHTDRINYPTLRDKDYRPKLKIYFDKSSYGYLFASPYTFINDVPVIGDWGLTYYLGNDEKIKDHYRKCYQLQNILIDFIKMGTKFSEIYGKVIKELKLNNLENKVYSTRDEALMNIGHTVPFIDRDPEGEEKEAISSGDGKLLNKAISGARIFINKDSGYEITENCAFTFEPRLTSLEDPSLPQWSFHTIVQFVEGKKIVLSNFNGVINLLGMDWMTQ